MIFWLYLLEIVFQVICLKQLSVRSVPRLLQDIKLYDVIIIIISDNNNNNNNNNDNNDNSVIYSRQYLLN